MTEQPSPASLLASMRWAKATEAEKKEVGRKMVEARRRIRRELEKAATLRTRATRRRSRKPASPKTSK